MPDIRIDERVFEDQRFLDLIVRIGNVATALGALVIACKVARKHWARKRKLVPVEEWEKLPHSADLLAVGLAEERDGSVYLKGSEEFFGRKRAAPREASPSSAVWESYRAAYRRRYGEDPVRNAMVNGQLGNLFKRLGTEAAAVAEFYVAHNGQFYRQTAHAVGPLVRDAEKLRLEWKRGAALRTGPTTRSEANEELAAALLLKNVRGEL